MHAFAAGLGIEMALVVVLVMLAVVAMQPGRVLGLVLRLLVVLSF